MADTPQAAPAAPTAPTADTTNTAAPAQQTAANQAAQVIADPSATAAQKAQAVKKLKSLRIKVDGQEFTEDLPFEIDASNKAAIDYMTRQAQMSRVAQKRMGEKAQLENEVRSFLDQLKANPRKVLSDPNLGVDLKKIAAQLIEEEIKNSQKSPEQLAREKLEEELRNEREGRKREQEEANKREFERIQQVEYERYDTMMTQSLEKSDLPKSPYVIKKMSDYLLMGLQEGMDVTPEDVLPLVREEILEDIKQMAQSMPLETIQKLFGNDILTKIRKSNVAKAKTAPKTANAKLPDVGTTKADEKKEVDPKSKKTFKSMFGV